MKEKLFNRNFILLLLGQVCSLIGNYTLKFALSMYVLERTGSAAIFAGLLAVATVPQVLLAPIGGLLADRLNRRNMMVALDALSGTAVFLTFLGSGGLHETGGFHVMSQEGPSLLLISILQVVLGILGAFESPTVQACVPQMQTGENLLKGNAAVSQIQAVAGLVTPFLGSLFHTAFGIRPVLAVCAACFFLTALLECFIRLSHQKRPGGQKIRQILRQDLGESKDFLLKKRPEVFRLLLLAALASFFVVGTAVVGLPFLVRNVLGLSANHYGAAESLMGGASVAGALAVGMLAGRLREKGLQSLLIAVGAVLIPAGAAFLLPLSTGVRYLILLVCFCIAQAVCSMFSILALSMIQESTPEHLTGKIMACVIALSTCAQPVGQVVYGLLFDLSAGSTWLVLLPTAAVLIALGGLSAGFLQRFAKE